MTTPILNVFKDSDDLTSVEYCKADGVTMASSALSGVLSIFVGLLVAGQSLTTGLPLGWTEGEDLRAMVSDARVKGHLAFNKTCPRLAHDCEERRQDALTTGDYPAFNTTTSGDIQVVTEIFQVTYVYYNLTNQLFQSVCSVSEQGLDVTLCDLIEAFCKTHLGSVLNKSCKMIPADQRTLTTPPPSLSEAQDVTNRNALNIRVLARAAHELQRMQDSLDKVISERG